MPPSSRSYGQSFIALFVEEQTARLWNVEIATGAMDEIARFSVEGMKRVQILEIARQFARVVRPPTVAVEAIISETSTPAPVKRGRGRPRKNPEVAPRKHTRPDEEGLKYTEKIARQHVRQAELFEALKAYGGAGVSSTALAAQLGRGGPQNVGVSLAVLQRQGKSIQIDGLWYAVENGNIPPPPK